MKKKLFLTGIFSAILIVLSILSINSCELFETLAGVCTTCDGSGNCQKCDGTGSIPLYSGSTYLGSAKCGTCDGTGDCQSCGGDGKI
jgi:hypothetical protein